MAKLNQLIAVLQEFVKTISATLEEKSKLSTKDVLSMKNLSLD